MTDRGVGIGTGGDSEIGGTGMPYAKGISVIDSTLDITVNGSRAEKIGKGVLPPMIKCKKTPIKKCR